MPNIDEYCKQIQVNVRAMNANLNTFNEKEKEKVNSRNEIVNLIEMQFGVRN